MRGGASDSAFRNACAARQMPRGANDASRIYRSPKRKNLHAEIMKCLSKKNRTRGAVF